MKVTLSMMEERGVLQQRVQNANTILKHVLASFLSIPDGEWMEKVAEKCRDYQKRYEELTQYDNDARTA